MKNFLKGASKIALAMVLAVVALALLGAIANVSYEAYKKHQLKPLEISRFWAADLSQHLGMTMTAKTKLVDSNMYLSTSFAGSPPFLSDPRLAVRNLAGAITVSFADADGFKIHEEKIPIPAFTSTLNDKGEKSGLDYQSSQYMDAEKYARMARIEVSWNLDTKPISAAPPQVTPELSDHCAPNLSRAERLKRLGAHGQIREAGKNNFEVGYLSLYFFDDGSLLNCR